MGQVTSTQEVLKTLILDFDRMATSRELAQALYVSTATIHTYLRPLRSRRIVRLTTIRYYMALPPWPFQEPYIPTQRELLADEQEAWHMHMLREPNRTRRLMKLYQQDPYGFIIWATTWNSRRAFVPGKRPTWWDRADQREAWAKMHAGRNLR